MGDSGFFFYDNDGIIRGKLYWISFYCIKFVYILLNEGSYMVRFKFKGWGSIICYYEDKENYRVKFNIS